MDQDDDYAKCDWCKRSIRYGSAMLTINRQIEQIDRDESYPDGVITVIEAQPILTLCAGCGNRLDDDGVIETLKSGFATRGRRKFSYPCVTQSSATSLG